MSLKREPKEDIHETAIYSISNLRNYKKYGSCTIKHVQYQRAAVVTYVNFSAYYNLLVKQRLVAAFVLFFGTEHKQTKKSSFKSVNDTAVLQRIFKPNAISNLGLYFKHEASPLRLIISYLSDHFATLRAPRLLGPKTWGLGDEVRLRHVRVVMEA